MRTSLRAMFAQTGAYNVNLDGVAIAAGAAATAIPGISVGDLDGRYFNDAAYAISAVAADSYTLTATGANSTAPGNADVAAVTITLSNAGAFTRTGL